jgi:trk system potassium uptake protein TrkA
MSGEFAVIGLGQFGRAVAVSLVREGQPVLAIDVDRERAQMVEGEVDAVMVADATQEAALAELGLERMACVVVAMGVRSRDVSIMATALLRQRGVPRIVSRAVSDLHGRVLLAVGAHEIVNPEHSLGVTLAWRLAHPHVTDQFALDVEHVVAEVEVPQGHVGARLRELELRERWRVDAVVLKHASHIAVRPSDDEVLESGDLLVLVGNPAAIRRFAAQA